MGNCGGYACKFSLKCTWLCWTHPGLIFLKFADAKYAKFEMEINKEYEVRKDGRRAYAEIFEIAIEKCQRGSKAKYAYGILRNWKNEGVKTLEDIEKEDRSDWSWAEKKAGFKEVWQKY